MEIRRQVWKRISYKTIFGVLFLLSLGFTTFAQEKTAAGLYNEGFDLLKAKDYEAAMPLLEEALKLGTENNDEEVIKLTRKNGAVAAYKIGSAKRKAKLYDEAMASYKKGIEFNPDYYANYIGVAQVLSKQGKKVEASAGYIEAAQVATRAGKEDKAEDLYSRSEKLVAIFSSKKQWDNTLTASEALLAVHESANLHYYRARALNSTGKRSDAKTHLSKAFDLAGDMSEEDKSRFYMLKAQILEKEGNKTGAIDAYKKVTGEKYIENAQYKIKTLSGR